MSAKLFTLGPTEMFEYTREKLAEQLPYFRTREFSMIVLECAEKLKSLSGAPDNAHVFMLTCSGTGAMEAVVAGCFNEQDRLCVIDGGGFGRRFADLSAHHRIPYESLKLNFGDTLEAKSFGPEFLDFETCAHKEKDLAAWFTGLLVNVNETTTGQLYDIKMLASICRKNGQYLVCDAISAFLADPLDFEEDGIDALIISSQKALALPPGLSVVILSDRMYKRIADQKIRPFSMYFDFRDAEANAVRGQTPFTPAVGTILALHDRLEHIEAEGGQSVSVSRTKALAEDFRGRIKGLLGKEVVTLPAYPLSNALTPLIFPNGGAMAVFEKLSRDHDVWLNPNGGALADTTLRVGHLGDLTVEDNMRLIELLSDIL